MDKKLCLQLAKEFPKLYKDMYTTDKGSSCLYYGIECRDGWYKLIYDLSAKIEPLIDSDQLFAVQVKEKFGALRFYMSKHYNKEVNALIEEAEANSTKICHQCGEPGTIRKEGWYRTVCDVHNT